jgi:hypothetical protein
MCTALLLTSLHKRRFCKWPACLPYLHWTVTCDAALYTHNIYIYIYIYVCICSWVCVKLSPEMGQILEVFYMCHDSWAPILKMFSQDVLWMQVRVVVSESSQPLSSCHALKRADYIFTLWLRWYGGAQVSQISHKNLTYFTHISNILDQTY